MPQGAAGGDATVGTSASEVLWLELRKAIPDAEEDGVTLRDFRALSQVQCNVPLRCALLACYWLVYWRCCVSLITYLCVCVCVPDATGWAAG